MQNFEEIKKNLTPRNKELLQEKAKELAISEDEVLSKVPSSTMLFATFNPKVLGGYLKRMVKTTEDGAKQEIPSEEVVAKQVTDDLTGDNKEKYEAILSKIKKNPEIVSSIEQKAGMDLNEIGIDKATGSIDIPKLAYNAVNHPIPSEAIIQDLKPEVEELIGNLPSTSEDQ